MIKNAWLSLSGVVNTGRRSTASPAQPAGLADVAILGAGIMGCCLALELARRGRRVALFDQAAQTCSGASRHNEGKLHLGFVYANDPDGETHPLMARGSLTFTSIIGRLTGTGSDDLQHSRPFDYFVPADSLLDVDTIERHFAAVARGIRDLQQQGDDEHRYPGLGTGAVYARNPPQRHQALFDAGRVLASFQTVECSVSTAQVAERLQRAVLATPNIRLQLRHEILAAVPQPGGAVEIETRSGAGMQRLRYPCVVNCLWDGQQSIDDSAGLIDPAPRYLRYKATLHLHAPGGDPGDIPSATGILGPYGDIVNHGNGRFYLSWYPLCKLAQTGNGRQGRQLHAAVHAGFWRTLGRRLGDVPGLGGLLARLAHRGFVRANLQAMARHIPAVTRLLHASTEARLGGGVIVARGNSDITDPASQLHQRWQIGPVQHGAYVSVDTGKYCMAPWLALRTADLVTDILG